MQIETTHLIVRDFLQSDSFDVFYYLKDERVMQYIEPVFNQEQANEFVHVYGCVKKMVYALIEKETNQLIGHIIFHPYDSLDEYEIGWIIKRSSWGKGYATEISKALIEYGFHQLKLKRIVAEVVSSNKAACNVIQKLGMSENKMRSGTIIRLYELL